jgi:regulator of replication initiation timing
MQSGTHSVIVAMKRAPFTQSSAGDHCAQSSTGSHCADNASKNARIHPSLRSNQSRSQHSSDSTHFTGKVANVLRAPSHLLAPDGSCAFCDDAAEAANDLQRLVLPPLQASVISVGRCIANNHCLSEQLQKMRADIAANNEQCQNLEDINVATVAENQELHERFDNKQTEIRGLLHSRQELVQEVNKLERRDSDLCAKIGILVRAEQDLVEEVKRLKSDVHALSFEVHTLRMVSKPSEEDPPVSSTGSSQECLESLDRSDRQFFHQL